MNVRLLSSPPPDSATPKDFISLKPQAEKSAKKDPAKSRVKNRD